MCLGGEFLSNQKKINQMQKNQILTNDPDSGSAYIREHAGHIEGYGEEYQVTNDSSQTESPKQ